MLLDFLYKVFKVIFLPKIKWTSVYVYTTLMEEKRRKEGRKGWRERERGREGGRKEREEGKK
jgi:hypothetical protein